ncbi:MAG TPA: biotin--[acetyl-CoA-carboxylase] ligase [Gammaproteobacteria bacterium]|nr:biotin--[acetyl-CoA-carboxylase] ligase [Gammaproteobacteria bacterium]
MNKYNPNFPKLFALLNDGNVHEGSAIGKRLGISRNAVWKLMNQLGEEGIPISSYQSKGYQLLAPVHLLDKEQILAALKPKTIRNAVALTVYHTVDSTNDVIKKLPQSDKIQFCVSEKQLQGRGRRNDPWLSPFGVNIYLSCLYPLQKDICEYSGLSIVVGLSLIQALVDAKVDVPLQIKWPNDILCQGKKCGGILVELNVKMHMPGMAVIGIGLNVNQPFVPYPTDLKAISLGEVAKKNFDRNILIAAIIKSLLGELSLFSDAGFSPFMKMWENYDCLKGKMITIQAPKNTVQGEAMGITEQGLLKLKDQNGEIRTFSAGDVTLSGKKAVGKFSQGA